MEEIRDFKGEWCVDNEMTSCLEVWQIGPYSIVINISSLSSLCRYLSFPAPDLIPLS
jgi:hypothetical protein